MSSERKPGGCVTAGAKRDWKAKWVMNSSPVYHTVSLPWFPPWGASRKQICESHWDLPHIPKLCPVSAGEELLVTVTGKVGKDKASASSGRFLAAAQALLVTQCLWKQELLLGSPSWGPPTAQPWQPSLSVVLTHVALSFCLSLCRQWSKAMGSYDGSSLSLCGYTGVSVWFNSKKLGFGWQLLNCTVPLCAAGTEWKVFSQTFH